MKHKQKRKAIRVCGGYSGSTSGFSLGFTGSVGFVNGEFITDTPVGGSLVIITPYGFKLGEGLRFNLSLTLVLTQVRPLKQITTLT